MVFLCVYGLMTVDLHDWTISKLRCPAECSVPPTVGVAAASPSSDLCAVGVPAVGSVWQRCPRRSYIASITALMPTLPQIPFCPVSHKILEIMDMDENALHDFL